MDNYAKYDYNILMDIDSILEPNKLCCKVISCLPTELEDQINDFLHNTHTKRIVKSILNYNGGNVLLVMFYI